jgi:hypothetical protein
LGKEERERARKRELEREREKERERKRERERESTFSKSKSKAKYQKIVWPHTDTELASSPPTFKTASSSTPPLISPTLLLFGIGIKESSRDCMSCCSWFKEDLAWKVIWQERR